MTTLIALAGATMLSPAYADGMEAQQQGGGGMAAQQQGGSEMASQQEEFGGMVCQGCH